MNKKRVSDTLHKTQQEPSENSMLKTLFGKKERPWWPLWFTNYSFGARCYNTLKCSILFSKSQHSVHENEPSGQPYSADWKEDWRAGYSTAASDEEFMRKGFPTPIMIDWTALDGKERQVDIDLNEIFPHHEIIHNVPKEVVREYWATKERRNLWILLEVNDRTISIYSKIRIPTTVLADPENDPTRIVSHTDLMLVWTKTFD